MKKFWMITGSTVHYDTYLEAETDAKKCAADKCCSQGSYYISYSGCCEYTPKTRDVYILEMVAMAKEPTPNVEVIKADNDNAQPVAAVA